MKRLLGFIKKYVPLICLTAILSAGAVSLTLYAPILIGRAFDSVIGVGNVDTATVFLLAIKALVCACISGVIQLLCGRINNKITFSVASDIRRQAIKKLQRLPISFIDAHPVGETVSRIINDTEALSDGLLLGFTQLFSGVFSVIATLIFMLLLDWRIALAVAVLTPASMLVASFIAKRTYKYSKQQSVTKGLQTALIDEKITYLKTVKALGCEKTVVNDFKALNGNMEADGLKAVFFSSLVNPSTRFVNSVIYAFVGLFGGMITVSGGLTVGGLTCFLSYVNQYTKPFNEISGVVAEMQNALACAERVFDLLDEAEISESAEKQFANIDGNIAVDNVSFGYSKNKTIIKDISVNVKKGSRVAVVGHTGCGKTTLINLLMRFYDADAGDILIDGESIYSKTRKSLRKCVGMVLQETWLKSGTIAENIAFGKADATMDEIVEAAKQANAHSFIKKLENGYNTALGENGDGLSTGQKQLLCIARIMLLSPEILILDEATSSIDTLTEKNVQDAFLKLLEGKTSFIVAHRLSTIKNCDIILVMDNGEIVERGAHKELLKKNGLYADLYYSRLSEK